MAITDTSYYVGEYLVPNTSGTHPASTVNAATLNRFILLYEKDYLTKLLGKALYDVFIANPSAEWVVSLTAQLRDTVSKTSPIAAYVWFYWKKDSTSSISSQGELQQNNENAGIISPINRLKSAYNECVLKTYEVFEWMQDNYSIFPSAPDPDYEAFRPINDFGI